MSAKHNLIIVSTRGYIISCVIVVLFITFALIAGCATIITHDYCELYEPITLDLAQDTPQTIREVLYNNKLYEKFCIQQ
jgi:hypothetical protein